MVTVDVGIVLVQRPAKVVCVQTQPNYNGRKPVRFIPFPKSFVVFVRHHVSSPEKLVVDDPVCVALDVFVKLFPRFPQVIQTVSVFLQLSQSMTREELSLAVDSVLEQHVMLGP